MKNKLLRIFLILFIALNVLQSKAGDIIIVILKDPRPGIIRMADQWDVSLNNTSKLTYRIRIEITLDEAVAGRVGDGKSGIITLPPGVKKITYDDVKTGSSVNFKAGPWKDAFTQTGNAPSGDYTICIYVKDEAGDEHGNYCSEQKVEIASPPTLASPGDGEKITEPQSITFTWLPPMPTAQGVKYTLRIAQILGNESPDAALRRGTLWLEKKDISITTFQYPISARKLENGKKYAWQVQAIDKNGKPYGGNNGASEGIMFEVQNQ